MENKTTGGLFLSVEGGDWTGKSTQIQALAQSFRQIDARVLTTFEPGDSPLGHTLRQLIQHGPGDVDPRTEALLYAADRAYHVSTVIRPALQAQQTVLCDRYLDSSVAYQGAARQLGPNEIRNLSLWATQDLLPKLTILLDGDPALLSHRHRGERDRLESESLEFHQAVRDHFLDLAKAEPDRFTVIAALGTPAQVHGNVIAAVNARLGLNLQACL